MVKVKFQILVPVLWLALVVRYTLALRTVLGSESDVTGNTRWWIRVMMSIDVKASVRLSHRVEGFIVDINGEGEVSGPYVRKDKLRINLGSSSDVKCHILAPGLVLALVRH
ncbi:Ubiquitin Carboxyl-Terminal Hydrolase 22 [Manis pentadactyla]|nr:Ubiquitin Carboxyl-Terminal Hydrolase 22 [Manis pentadactyla]